MQAVSCTCDDSSLSTEAGQQQQQRPAITDPFQLPAPCLELMLQRLPIITKSRLRQVSRQARSAVHEATCELSLAQSATQDQMTHMPVWLPQCWRLQQLQLFGTKALTDLSGLPSNLQALYLIGCYALTDFSPLLACTNLRELSLGHRFDCLERHSPPVACEQLQSLSALVSSHVFPTTPNPRPRSSVRHETLWMQTAAAVLPRLTTLTRFELCAAIPYRRTRAAGQLAKAIGTCSALQELRLHVNGIEYVAPQLVAALPLLQHLTFLDLSSTADMQDSPLDLAWLAPGLSRLSALCTLGLQDNPLDIKHSLAPLAPALNALASCASLRRLDLQSTKLDFADVLGSGCLPNARIYRADEWLQLPGDRAELHVKCDKWPWEYEYEYEDEDDDEDGDDDDDDGSSS